MILNIIDRRTNRYRWKTVDAIIEPTWHDNEYQNSDQAEHDYREPSYAARKNLSLADAVTWASSTDVPMTLYLYDEGSDTIVADWPASDPISN